MAHITRDCVNVKVICKRCKSKWARNVFKGHNCVIGFISQVKPDDSDSLQTALNEMQTQFETGMRIC